MLTKTGTPPKATVAEQSDARTLWLIQWPSTRKGVYATTYAGSDKLTLETLARRYPVGPRRANRLAGTVRAAILRASAG